MQSKLDEYKAKVQGGGTISNDQKQAVARYDGVITSLEFARELQKQFIEIHEKVSCNPTNLCLINNRWSWRLYVYICVCIYAYIYSADLFLKNEKQLKKKLKAEIRAKHIEEVNRMQEVLRLQSLLDSLGADSARADFKSGAKGAMVSTSF